MSIQFRITLMFALLLCLVMGISAFLINSFLLDNLIEQQKNELNLKGRFWIEKMNESNVKIETEGVAELEKLLVSNRKIEVLLLGKKKKVLYTSLPSSNLNGWMDALERKAEKRQNRNIWIVGSDDYVVVNLPFKNDEKQRLILASPVRGLKDTRMEMTNNILLIVLIGAVSTILLSFFITRSMVQPLHKLTREIKKVQARRFSEVQLIPARGEIAEVSNSVYSMAQELDRFHEIQRQFLQNASHELKTPLMSIQGYAEGIRDGVFVDDAAEKGFDVIVEETNRLKHIVTEIILLAKLEGEENLFDPSWHSATDLVTRTIERLHPLQLQHNVTITVRPTKTNDVVYVDEGKFLQALLNIIGNALRHAKDQITIEIKSGKRQLQIEVQDDGEGISEELLPHLFHRFVKGKNGDVGLGLAISRAIIERSHGCLQAENGPLHGAIFRITLPLYPQPENSQPPE